MCAFANVSRYEEYLQVSGRADQMLQASAWFFHRESEWLSNRMSSKIWKKKYIIITIIIFFSCIWQLAIATYLSLCCMSNTPSKAQYRPTGHQHVMWCLQKKQDWFSTPCLSRLELSLPCQCHQGIELSWGVYPESDLRKATQWSKARNRLFPNLAISLHCAGQGLRRHLPIDLKMQQNLVN